MQKTHAKLFMVLPLLISAHLAHGQEAEAPKIESPAPRSAQRESEMESPVAQADEAESGLSGNWGGARPGLSHRGIDLALIFKYDAGRNVAGGMKVGSYGLCNFDARLAIDTGKAGLWENGSFFFYYLLNDGENPTDFIGDRQVTSNIETSPIVSRLYEAWYQHLFADGKASLLVGLHDLNSEFYVTPTSGVFLNASFGIGHEIAQTGASGPSIFPVTSPTIRFRAEPSKYYYLQAAIFNAVAGDPNHPHGTHMRFNSEDGALLVTEAAWTPGADGDLAGKYAVGTWAYTKPVDHVNGTEKTTNHGTYLLIDQNVSSWAAGFIRAGVASTDANETQANLGAGVTFKGLLPSRAEDVFGIAVTMIHAGEAYRQAQEAAGTPIDGRETTLEVTYRIEVVPGFVLQPDWQYIDRPNYSREIPYASAIGARAELSF